MKIQLNESKEISAGEHSGAIVDIQEKEVTKDGNTYNYMDVIVSIDGMTTSEGKPITRKYGMALREKVTPKSKLGQFLKQAGVKLGSEIDTKSLVGRKVKVVIQKNPDVKTGKVYDDIVSFNFV